MTCHPRRIAALPRVYLRRTPATAPDRHGRRPDRYAVVAYRSPNASDVIGRWTWWSAEKPSPRAAFLTINDRRCRAIWLEV